jgi:hypothetical protein
MVPTRKQTGRAASSPGNVGGRPWLSATLGGAIAWGTAIAGIGVVDALVRQILLEDLRTNLGRTAASTAALIELIRRVDMSAALGISIAGVLALLNALSIWRVQRGRQKAVAAEMRIREHLNRAHELANLGTWYASLDNRTGSMSPGLRRLIGDSVNAAAPIEAYLAATHPDDRPLVEDLFAAVCRTANSQTLDHRFLVNGSIKYVRAAGGGGED